MHGLPKMPLHRAVAVVCALAIPLAFFLGKFNVPIWVCFVVWAEYFALGGTPDTWRQIIPSIPFGAATGAAWSAGAIAVGNLIGGELAFFWGFLFTNFVFLTLMVYLMPRVAAWRSGSLAVFNGLALFFAVFFTKSVPALGPMQNTYWVIALALVWTVTTAYIGWVLGWLNGKLAAPPQAAAQSPS